MLVARLLHPADDDDRREQAAIARAFRLFLLLHLAVRTLLWAGRGDHVVSMRALLAGALAVCAGVALVDARRARAASAVAMLLLAVKLGSSFPETSNHFFIEFLCVGLLALCDLDDAEERALLLGAARWLTVIVLFHSGLQKLWHGTYFDGQFLGYSIGLRSSFAGAMGWLIPADEIARLQALHPPAVGGGPYAIQSPLALLVSNGVYVFELLAPVLLIVRRTRPYAAVAAVLFVVAIESGAREFMFGALYVNLLLLFLSWPLNRALLPVFAALFSVLIAARFGALPEFWFN